MSPADIMLGHEKAVLQGRRGDECPPGGCGIILIDVRRTGRI